MKQLSPSPLSRGAVHLSNTRKTKEIIRAKDKKKQTLSTLRGEEDRCESLDIIGIFFRDVIKTRFMLSSHEALIQKQEM